jgi:hypothetical protein
MKLVVSWMRELSTYVSREFFYVMRDLIEVHGWRQVEPPLLARRSAVDICGDIPEAVLFWEAWDLCIAMQPALSEAGCQVCLFADDLHQLWGYEHLRATRLRAFSVADKILCPYAYVFDDFYPELRETRRLEWIPHAASPDFDLAMNENPENAILLTGAGGPCYPLRGRMKDLEEQGRYPIVHQAHPGYGVAHDYENDPRVGRGYALGMNRYLAALTDALTFRYIVAKHFEIPAAGLLLMTDAAMAGPLRELGFIANEHYLPATTENLEELIRYVVDPANRSAIDAIRANGQRLVRSRHRTSDRARAIDAACGESGSAS